VATAHSLHSNICSLPWSSRRCQFTAPTCLAWDVIQAHTRATTSAAAQFSTPCCTACPFHPRCASRRRQASSPPSSKRCHSAACACSCFPTLSQLNGAVERRQPHSHRGVLPGHPLFPRNEKNLIANSVSGKRSTTPCVLTSRSLPYPAAVPAAGLAQEGMKVSPIYWTSTGRFGSK